MQRGAPRSTLCVVTPGISGQQGAFGIPGRHTAGATYHPGCWTRLGDGLALLEDPPPLGTSKIL